MYLQTQNKCAFGGLISDMGLKYFSVLTDCVLTSKMMMLAGERPLVWD